jgi:HEAT repeat protein
MNHNVSGVSYRAADIVATGLALATLCMLYSALANAEPDDTHTQQQSKKAIPANVPPECRSVVEKLLRGNYAERAQAISTVSRMGPHASPVAPYVIDNLDNSMVENSTNPVSIGTLAYHAIEDLGEPAVEPLIAALRVKQYTGQKRADILRLLGSIGDRRAVPASIAALEDDRPEVREWAAWALFEIPDARSSDALMRCLRDKNVGVVRHATLALGEIGDRRAVEPIIALLRNRRESRQSSVQWEAAHALGRLGDPRAFDALLAAYKGKKAFDWPVRNEALQALGHTKDPRSFDLLREALKSSEWHERAAAAWGLAGLGDARSISLLTAILKDERPKGSWLRLGSITLLRPVAARALVGTGGDVAIAAVFDEYLASPESSEKTYIDLPFRTAAVDALAMSPKPPAYLKTIDILGGTDVWMRRETARVLYSSMVSQMLIEVDVPEYDRRKLPALADMRVLQALMKAAESHPESKHYSKLALEALRQTREYAVKALKKSGHPEALGFVEKLEKEMTDKGPPRGRAKGRVER